MSKKVHEATFTSFDNTELFYRAWEPVTDTSSKKALIVIHRGHEHSGRLHDLIDGMQAHDCWAFGYDSRGHGRNEGQRGYAPHFSDLIKDLDSFVSFISKKYDIPIQNMFIVANSVGAVIASTWVHDFAPPIRGMILAAPAFKIKLYIPFALLGLRILNAIKHPAFITSYVKSKFLTHDQEQAKFYDQDKLITPQIAVNILVGLFDFSSRIVKDAGAIETPTLVFSAGSDYVVYNEPQKYFFDHLSSVKKEHIILEGFYHGVLYEKDRHIPFKRSCEFIKECFEIEQPYRSLKESHKSGFTFNEYQTLLNQQRPIYIEFYYLLLRFLMHTLGLLSNGIRIGINTGFDSGLSLDYVYKNKPSGFTLLGKLIDAGYLNSIGWKGIRQRKINIKAAINSAISDINKQNKPVRIMDIASGPGRYLLEIAKEHHQSDLKVLIRDHDIKNINSSKAIAQELGLNNAEFLLADAFEPSSYQKQEFRPNIVIVSGLFELFSDNDLVEKAISGITSIIDNNSYVIYSGQPWHPQLELISQTLNNRDNNRWVMRRRTQLELDQLFQLHGAMKEKMWIDDWGIFTISKAQIKK